MADETPGERSARYAKERAQRDAAREALEKRERRQWVAVGVALAVVVGLGVKFYFWLEPAPADVAARWGDLGSAVAPFVALLTVGALLAALWSVHLQRIELRETREEMFEQRLQFERTAEAQEALAGSQAKLASEQHTANGIALKQFEMQTVSNRLAAEASRRAVALELAQRAHVVATLLAAQIDGLSNATGAAGKLGQPTRTAIQEQLDQQTAAYEALRKAIAEGSA